MRRFLALLPEDAEVLTPYGATECLPVSTISLDDIRSAGTGNGVCVGTPVPGAEIEIRPLTDETGAAQPDLPFGEIVVRAPHIRLGYDRLWHTTHKASQPHGTHATGDVGFVDSAGRLWMGGRVADVVWTSGGAVAPVQAEQAVENLDGVAMAAMVGVGPQGSQAAVVIVEFEDPVAKPGLADLDMIDRVRHAVAAIEGPQIAAVLAVPKLPVDRRHNSKIDRGRLREWAGNLLAGGKMESI